MNASPSVDDEVLGWVSATDPLLDSGASAFGGLDTEAALCALAPDLDERIVQPLRRRGLRLRTGLVAISTAGAAFLVVNLAASGHGQIADIVSPAHAAMIVKEAQKGLLYAPGSILEQDAVTRQSNPDGSITWSEEHSWVSTTAPYDNRLISTGSGRSTFEQATVGGRVDYFDPAENTIYDYAPPNYDFKSGPVAGTELLTVPSARLEGACPGPPPPGYAATVTLTVTAAQAEALRRGADIVAYRRSVESGGVAIQTDPQVIPTAAAPPNPNATSTLAQVRYMLHTAGVNVDPSETLDGAPAVRITSADGSVTYWASANTFRPLQVMSKMDANAGATVRTTRFPTTRLLSGAAASQSLLSLTSQHPGARIDNNGDDYARAGCRLRAGG
jgi:hypothetical protein